MLCEECGVREATIAMVVRAGGESTTRHLCPECMKRVHQELLGKPIQDLLSGILSAISDGDESASPQEDIVCPQCGRSLHEFQRTGRLGCAGCYQAFREQLQPMLLRIHGRAQHAGFQPEVAAEKAANAAAAAAAVPDRKAELTRLMAQAVAVEDFETAAQLRDELRTLQAKEEHA